MATTNVLIVGDEPILAYGLKVQFERWAFRHVDIIEKWNNETWEDLKRNGLGDCMRNYSLVVLDLGHHFRYQDHPFLDFVLECPNVPIIVFASFTERLPAFSYRSPDNFRRLRKPCPLPILQKAVEGLLQVRLSNQVLV